MIDPVINFAYSLYTIADQLYHHWSFDGDTRKDVIEKLNIGEQDQADINFCCVIGFVLYYSVIPETNGRYKFGKIYCLDENRRNVLIQVLNLFLDNEDFATELSINQQLLKRVVDYMVKNGSLGVPRDLEPLENILLISYFLNVFLPTEFKEGQFSRLWLSEFFKLCKMPFGSYKTEFAKIILTVKKMMLLENADFIKYNPSRKFDGRGTVRNVKNVDLVYMLFVIICSDTSRERTDMILSRLGMKGNNQLGEELALIEKYKGLYMALENLEGKQIPLLSLYDSTWNKFFIDYGQNYVNLDAAVGIMSAQYELLNANKKEQYAEDVEILKDMCDVPMIINAEDFDSKKEHKKWFISIINSKVKGTTIEERNIERIECLKKLYIKLKEYGFFKSECKEDLFLYRFSGYKGPFQVDKEENIVEIDDVSLLAHIVRCLISDEVTDPKGMSYPQGFFRSKENKTFTLSNYIKIDKTKQQIAPSPTFEQAKKFLIDCGFVNVDRVYCGGTRGTYTRTKK